MAPKRTTRSTPVTTTTLTTTKALLMYWQHVTLTEAEMVKTIMIQARGTEGVVELTQWFERMETVFRISNCSMENQIKFSTCTLLGSALTWWNSHVKMVGHDVAYAMTWTNLKNKMTDKYCPRGEVTKLEGEMWNLKVKESNKIEKYVSGLPDMIHESVMASKPKTMHDVIEFVTELMDKKIRSGEKKPYRGSKPLCSKCNYHHDGQCAPKCHKCNRFCHLARDCRSTTNANTANNQRGTEAGQKPTCYECGAQGYFKRGCPKLKNNNRSNQGGNGNAPAKVYAVGRTGTNPDSNRYSIVAISTALVRRKIFEGGNRTRYGHYEFQVLLWLGRNAPANKKEYEEHLKAILEESVRKMSCTYISKCNLGPQGLVGCYQRFIKGFSKIAKSMTKLTQKEVKFDWGDKQEAVFQLIKQKLCSAPILALLERSKDFMCRYQFVRRRFEKFNSTGPEISKETKERSFRSSKEFKPLAIDKRVMPI
ncbi:putative reverse transcriptase domain-containing protein [Tanacetum coccineum]